MILYRFVLLSLLTLFIITGCTPTEDPLAEITTLEAQIDTAPPTLEQLNLLTAKYVDYVDAHPEETDRNAEFLSKAADVAEQQGLMRKATLLRLRAIREYYTAAQTPDNIKGAAVHIANRIQEEYPTSDTLLARLQEAFPSEAEMEAGINAQIDRLRQAAMKEEEGRSQKMLFMEYAALQEIAAHLQPGAESASTHLSEAAKTYHSLKAFPKSLLLYSWILQNYPESEEAPRALFMRGYILENAGELEAARATYEEFLEKYPKQDLAPAAEISLKNLGRSPEEIVSEFEQ